VTRKILTCVLVASLLGVTGCSTIAEPDKVGLYYLEGSSDGYQFGECIDPGQTGDAEWNNSIVFLETNLRTWTIDDAEGADSKELITVSAKPQKDQPSGVQVKVSTKANFYLNTYCDRDGGVVRQFWERIGRRYSADTKDGWRQMLLKEFVPTQTTIIKDVVRNYEADPLIANTNGVQLEAQKEIARRVAEEFNRLTGGNFFCGPTFNRTRADCPSLELLIIGVEYADPGIQQARNEKQKAQELAAAQLARAQGEAAALKAEAEGKANAAKELEKLYANPAWVKLQLAILQAQMAKECGQNPNCHMIVGADGNIILQP
jgi:hypothetical protein